VRFLVGGRERKRAVNNLTFYFWSNPLTFNGQRIVGLCKLVTLNAVNFLKVGNVNT
jgi:hypothetical protein